MSTRRTRHGRNAGVRYDRYIRKIRTSVAPKHSITGDSVEWLNELVRHQTARIGNRCRALLRGSNHVTVSVRDIRTALHLELPTLLAQQADDEGLRAVETFTSNA